MSRRRRTQLGCIMRKEESTAVIIFNEDRKKVLLIQRRDIPVWVLPGGGIDPNESPEEAALREGEEETGFHLKIIRHVATYLPTHPLTKKTYFFECSIQNGHATTGDETKAVEYYPIDSLPKLLSLPFAFWIEDALNPTLPHRTLPTKGITYLAILKNLLLHPVFVTKFFITRLKKALNKY